MTDKRPHIGLNAQLLSLKQNYRGAGISWYIYNLLRQLDATAAFRYTVFLQDREFQAGASLQLKYSAVPTTRPVARILWEQLRLPTALKQTGVDLHHAMAFAAPVAVPCPFVTTIYDLSFKHFPEAFRPFNRLYLDTFTKYSAKRAKAVITISESTRQDVLQFYDIAPEKVHTVHCGVDEAYQPLSSAQIDAFRARQSLPSQFVFFLGTLEPRKNILGLIEAYAAWRTREKEVPKLFIGGGKGWYYNQVFQLVDTLGINDNVIFLGYLPSDDLPLWYNAATMLVYPSQFEGFGLPVLEAMACGTPVITSNVSSLPEVAGDAAWLVDPSNSAALSEAMQQLYSNEDLQHSMREKGLYQGKKFSWRKTAEETNQIYRKALTQ